MHSPACDELLATELVFSGVLKDLSPAEAVALISALVFQVRPNALLYGATSVTACKWQWSSLFCLRPTYLAASGV
eukprot:1160090-Pelagomonas_calceolata.AAC.5